MTPAAERYAQLLLELDPSAEGMDETRALVEDPDLREALENPVYTQKEKDAVIHRLFPQEVRRFFQVVCGHGDFDLVPDMLDAYDGLRRKRDGIAQVTFTCCHEPTPEQREKLEALVRAKYHKNGVEWHTVLDPALAGGFILEVDDVVLDKSLRTAVENLRRHVVRGTL